MMLDLHPSTVEWILQKMESLAKEVLSCHVWETQIIIEKIGKFNAYRELLDNAGFESYGLKFKVEIPTIREYSHA